MRVDDEGTLRFAFIDTGIGIGTMSRNASSKVLPVVRRTCQHDRGARVSVSRSRAVADARWELAIESELDHGSTFTFSMPKPKLAA